MSMFHLGPDGDEQIEAAPEFDPIQALRDQGLLSENAMPQEIEIAEAPLELTEVAPSVVPIDLDAFRTVEHEDVEVASPAPVVGTNPKDLIGATKPDISLVPAAGILYESQAMMDGAKKYGPYNWRSNPVLYRIYIAAAIRHLQQLLDGEDFDPISGVHHIGHARACLGIMADANETGNLVDDRPVRGPAGDMIRRFGDTGTYAK